MVMDAMSGGMRGVEDNAHQPPDSLCAPPCAGQGSDSGGREMYPPPLPCMRHVFNFGGTKPPQPHQLSLHERRRPEKTVAVRGGGTGRSNNIFQGIREATRERDDLKAP